jgi:hypothetical protein
LVEFAIAVPLLLTLTLGTVDGARMFATWNRAKTAAREGAEYAQFFPLHQGTTGVCASPNNVAARAQAEGSDLTVTVSPLASPVCQDLIPSSAIQPGQMVTVTVTAPFSFVTPFARTLWGDPVVRARVKITVQGA